MKTVQLIGRFGNVLWELAAAIKAFGSPEEFVAIHEAGISSEYEKWFQGITFVNKADVDEEKMKYHDQCDYEAIPPDTRHLKGYWQHIRYIEGVDMRAFFLPEPLENEYTLLHIRGGDFFPASYPVPGREYYLRAMEQLNVSPAHCRIITDDPEFAKGLLPEVKIWREDLITDFCRLLGAQFVVCASSTFSWWGGYMGNAEQVIIPSRWFYGQVPEKYDGVLFPRVQVLEM